MKSNSEIEIPDNEKVQVKENDDVDYWSKKYDISAEDLKKKAYNIGIYDRIIESYLQHAG